MPRNATSFGVFVPRNPTRTPVFTVTRSARGLSFASPWQSAPVARPTQPAIIQRRMAFIGDRPALQNAGYGFLRVYSPRNAVVHVAPLSIDLSQICSTLFG